MDRGRKVVLAGISEVVSTMPHFENPTFTEYDGYDVIETDLQDQVVGKQLLQNRSLKIKILSLTDHTSLVGLSLFFTLWNKDLLSQLQYQFFIYPFVRSEISNHAQVFKKRLEKWS